MGDADHINEDSSAGIEFFPPLYIQRYVLALEVLAKHDIQSVIDFGCSECGFMKLLPTSGCIEKAALVDIDRSLLITKKRAIFPEVHHFLQRRKIPLHVSLYHGTAEQMDLRIAGFDAVTIIEVIEHLHMDVLERVTKNIFGCLQPRLCFVTTPNSEFNVLFGNEDPGQFRHWDHKFEWTRAEFKVWCEQICTRFCYSVTYTGVGELVSDPEKAKLGPCSQAAIFISKSPNQGSSLDCKANDYVKEEGDHDQPYELIAESDFPFLQENLSAEEKVDQEVAFCLAEAARMKQAQEDISYGEQVLISVSQVAKFRSVRALTDIEGVRTSLERQEYILTPNKEHVIISDEHDSADEDLEKNVLNGDREDQVQRLSLSNHEDNKRSRHKPIPSSSYNNAFSSHVEEIENWDDVG